MQSDVILTQLVFFSIIHALRVERIGSQKPSAFASEVLLYWLNSGTFIWSLSPIPSDGNYFTVHHFWQVYLFARAIAQRTRWMENVKEKSRVSISSFVVVAVKITFTLGYR